jgi:hypothetical protein
MKLNCQGYLQSILQKFLNHVINTNLPCEICPSQFKENQTLNDNLNNLRGYLNLLLESIIKSAHLIPLPIRRIFSHIQEVAVKKFSNPDIKYSIISSFFFLRFINPALISPVTYNLLKTQPPLSVFRTTTILAKTLQIITGISNFIKEEYMMVLSDFIESRRDDMKHFIEKVGSISPHHNHSHNNNNKKPKRKSSRTFSEIGKPVKKVPLIKKDMNGLTLDPTTNHINGVNSKPKNSPLIPKLCLNEINPDPSTSQYFCEQVAYIYRQFAKEFDRITESLSMEKKEQQNFLKIMKKIQFQIEKTQTQIFTKLNNNIPTSAPPSHRLKKYNPDQDKLSRNLKRKSLKTSKEDRCTHYSPRVVESISQDKDRSKLDKIKGTLKSPRYKMKKERSVSLIERPFPVTQIRLSSLIIPSSNSSLKTSDVAEIDHPQQTPSSDSRITSSERDIHDNNKRLSIPGVPLSKTIPIKQKKKGHKLPLLQSLSTSNIPSLSNKHVRSNFLDEHIYQPGTAYSPIEPIFSGYHTSTNISHLSALITPRNQVSSQNTNPTKNITAMSVLTPRISPN